MSELESDGEAVPDSAHLRTAGTVRVRRGRFLTIGIMLLFALGVPVATAIASPDNDGRIGTDWVVLLLPGTVCVILLALLFVVARKRGGDAPLVSGADAATRRAVMRALRAGYAPNARIDSLARDLAAHTVRQTWLLWLIVAGASLECTGAIGLLVGGADGLQLADAILLLGSAAVLVTVFAVNQHRSRSYLRNTPTSAQP